MEPAGEEAGTSDRRGELAVVIAAADEEVGVARLADVAVREVEARAVGDAVPERVRDALAHRLQPMCGTRTFASNETPIPLGSV